MEDSSFDDTHRTKSARPWCVESCFLAVAIHCVSDMIGFPGRKKSILVNNVLSIRDLCGRRISTTTANILTTVNGAVVVVKFRKVHFCGHPTIEFSLLQGEFVEYS